MPASRSSRCSSLLAQRCRAVSDLLSRAAAQLDAWDAYHATFNRIDANFGQRLRITLALGFCGPSTCEQLSRATGLSVVQIARVMKRLETQKIIARLGKTQPEHGGAVTLWRMICGDRPPGARSSPQQAQA